MTMRTTAAFVVGLSTGWVLRSALGPSREGIVRGIVAAHRGRDLLRRVVSERMEWLDDLFAEGRARYEETIGRTPPNDEEVPHVTARPQHESAA
jgi:hypothetical protein